jgi:hypothetical protein
MTGKWDWRSQPLDHMSIPQLAMLADEGSAEAQKLIDAWKLKQAMRRPIAEPTDRYGRVTRREI